MSNLLDHKFHVTYILKWCVLYYFAVYSTYFCSSRRVCVCVCIYIYIYIYGINIVMAFL